LAGHLVAPWVFHSALTLAAVMADQWGFPVVATSVFHWAVTKAGSLAEPMGVWRVWTKAVRLVVPRADRTVARSDPPKVQR